MAEFEPPPVTEFFFAKPKCALTTFSSTEKPDDPPFLPYWARCSAQHAQNLLDYSDEPIEYDHDDEDYRDNCFFFPEDCSWTPPKDWVVEAHRQLADPEIAVEGTCQTGRDTDTMIPGLPDIKMLDAEALSDLLEDNLSPPEITTILVFATNGAVFAYGSSLPSRQLRNLSATYGAAYTCYAKTASSGNLTGVNPASHPSSYVTAQSMSLGDVGSIVFELDDSVAVVTRIADKVLLAAVGPSKLDQPDANGGPDGEHLTVDGSAVPATDSAPGHGSTPDGSQGDGHRTPTASTSPNPPARNGHLDAQHEIDRSADLARLESLNLSACPAVLLALESKCAALGKFLGQKLDDLESPEDF
ncbi:hypothetical protein NUU61_009907 [Penicillium alfredii]|uniref:Uncharacterized protein n=1 Tax=Penicillium alfredii TaxID=1506179 RepID=A0A9W9JTY6_9EURO|nr:uncharacterized protein NUU61_009907 [Penicillium alfredii]KAJ5081643.1 hypothetical protein NUU61_009907 [Penicillium alfredii]